jgi:hypothetical protein
MKCSINLLKRSHFFGSMVLSGLELILSDMMMLLHKK